MELHKRASCFYFVMLLAASEGLKTILNVVGGNVTLPDPVPEEGFLLRESKNLVHLSGKKLNIYEETYRDRVLWDQTSGLFTITKLQKSDSGVYNIDSKKGNVVTAFYNLTVFDSAAPPAVQRLNSSSDSCWLLCCVDRLSSLSWFKGQKKLEQRDSVFSLNVSISREDLDSSFRCESSNPADKTSQTVDVKNLCSNLQTESTEESSRHKWAAIAIAIATSVFLIALVAFLIRRRNVHGNSRIPSRRELGTEDSVQYTAIQFQDRNTQRTSSDLQEASHLATVYDLLQGHRMDLTEAAE